MTEEAPGYNSEDAPARPATTRWSEDPVQDDDRLAPPYVPGRRTAAAAAEEDFPFDQFAADGDVDADTAASESATSEGAVGERAAAPDLTGAGEEFGSGSDEMIWSPDQLDDGDDPGHPGERGEPGERDRGEVSYAEETYAEETYAEETYAEETYAEETYGEWTPGYEEDDDASAVDAELEPITDEAPIEEVESTEVADVGREHRFEPDGSIESAGSDERVEEVAAVLDRLAGLLREEGEDAVRREMESRDRLTALVSSLLSGHLSARQ